MKKKIQILLIIIVTIACIFSGIYTRKQSAISVTQIATQSVESLSYLLETKNHKLLMIDGGDEEDSEHLEQILQQKGGVVSNWFITIAHSQNFGALQKIIENGNVSIENIYISFNSNEWYEEYEPDRYAEVNQFLSLLTEKSLPVIRVPEKHEILVDNLYVTTLNIANPDLQGDYAGMNQSMVIKVNNTYKSMIFMGNIANEAAERFKDNNLDEIDCDAVQVSNNGMQYVKDEIYQRMSPQAIFLPVPQNIDKITANDYAEKIKQKSGAEEAYLSCDGDITVKI